MIAWLPDRRTAGLLLLLTGLVWFSGLLQPVQLLEGWFADLRTQLMAPTTSGLSPVVVVRITDRSLAEFPYRSPVDRGFVATLVTALGAARPRAIGLDLLMDRPTEAAKDAQLEQALNRIGVPVVLAKREDSSSPAVDFLAGFLGGITNPLVEQAATNFVGDDDDVVRRADLRSYGHPVFAARLAELGGGTLPADRTVPIAWRNPAGNGGVETWNAEEILTADGQLNPAARQGFKGKVVLIGLELSGEGRYLTPFTRFSGSVNQRLAAVQLQARIADQLLEGRHLTTLPLLVELAIVLAAIGIGIGIGRGSGSVGGRVLVLAVAAVGLGWVALSCGLYTLGFEVPLVKPGLGLVLGATIEAAWKWVGIYRYIFIYFPPKVVKKISDSRDASKLGIEKRKITILFTDIADFTAFAERSEPNALATALNAYFDTVVGIIHKHDGTIDKFIGDAVMAFWNAPQDQPDHAEAALNCARALSKLGPQHSGLGTTRIGVHTGTAWVGGFGGGGRFAYTAIGDAVNTAARLEGANKTFGTTVLVSKDCVDLAEASNSVRPVARLLLKGKGTPIPVFTPLDEQSGPWVQDYRKAYQILVEKGIGDAAMKAWSELREKHREDPLVRFHVERLKEGSYPSPEGATPDTIIMGHK
jgi:class 3 adenylate cyclase/CHASE2 domain-containing sensor protein